MFQNNELDFNDAFSTYKGLLYDGEDKEEDLYFPNPNFIRPDYLQFLGSMDDTYGRFPELLLFQTIEIPEESKEPTRFTTMILNIDVLNALKKDKPIEPLNDLNVSYMNIPKSDSIVTNFNNSQYQFCQDLYNIYSQMGIKNRRAILYLIALNALESGWGEYSIENNLGGITAGSSWKGKTHIRKDKDDLGRTIELIFRSYDSISDYIKDHMEVLKDLYDFNLEDDFYTFVSKLLGNNKNHNKYALDPKYAEKLKSVFDALNTIIYGKDTN